MKFVTSQNAKNSQIEERRRVEKRCFIEEETRGEVNQVKSSRVESREDARRREVTQREAARGDESQ